MPEITLNEPQMYLSLIQAQDITGLSTNNSFIVIFTFGDFEPKTTIDLQINCIGRTSK